MAVYRFSAQVIGRNDGRSSTAAAAYRAGISITDARTGLTHDYTRRGGVVHAEIITPDGAPDWTHNRADLWNTVEKTERRKDAQLAREILTSLPHELDEDQRRDLISQFVKDEFVSRGMIADMAIHAPDHESDNRNHHAHIMLTMRPLADDGFGKKERSWNDKALLEGWRERWADRQNQALERAGLEIRVDHRSLHAQGIDREPEPKLGAVATKMERNGQPSKSGDDLRALWFRNAERELLLSESDAIDLDIAQEHLNGANLAVQGHEGNSGDNSSFGELFASQHAELTEECTIYQQQVDDYADKLNGRGRVALLWDKLRGRLGWNADQEYKTAQLALTEAQQRQEALQRAQEQQLIRVHQGATRAAEIERQNAEYEAKQERLADRKREKELKTGFNDLQNERVRQTEIDRHAELFREALNKKNDRERDID